MIYKNIKNHSFLIRLLLVILILILSFSLLYLHKLKNLEPYHVTNYAMGASIEQTVYGKNNKEAVSNAISSISNLESKISWRIQDSDISKINLSSGEQPVVIDETTTNILINCLDIAKKSNGAFDPTILPISSLWNFDDDLNQVPNNDYIKTFLQYVNFENLEVDSEKNTAFLNNSHASIDLGAAGKGAAVDAAINAYKNLEIDGGIISAGGSCIGVFGKKPTSPYWNIAIRDPIKAFENTQGEVGIISVKEGFISTSGSYEKYFEQNGKLYHHILNPKTGYPVENNLLSVTVVCNSGVLSDCLSTACFVLGPENSSDLLTQYDAYAVFIDNDKNIILSNGAEKIFNLTDEQFNVLYLSND